MIQYRFDLGDGTVLEFAVDETAGSTPAAPDRVPAWAQLARHRCEHCPLPEQQVACPAALAVVPVVDAFRQRISFEILHCTVQVGGVTMAAETPTQDAVRSLVGLLFALSDCPTLARLRPMATFHLPFASGEHTVFRVLGTYLLAQYLRSLDGGAPDWSLEGLHQLYAQLHKANAQLAARLREASEGDANVNSLVMLDTLAHAVDAGFERSVDRLRPLFAAYLRD